MEFWRVGVVELWQGREIKYKRSRFNPELQNSFCLIETLLRMAPTICKRGICSGVAKCQLFLWIKHTLQHVFLGELATKATHY